MEVYAPGVYNKSKLSGKGASVKPVRINKYLADAGICSRRKAEALVLEGRVTVNSRPVTDLSLKVDRRKDRVALDGVPVEPEEKKIYLILNKPEGVISSADDELDRKTVMDYVTEAGYRLHYAGRLDSDTGGLVFLTNDGEISQKLTHPRNKIPKTYAARIRGIPDKKALAKFRSGIELDDGLTAPAQIRIIKTFSGSCDVEIVLTEGRKRQVRRMCAEIGHPVTSLRRTAVGRIRLGRLKEGTYRHLKKDEMDYLAEL